MLTNVSIKKHWIEPRKSSECKFISLIFKGYHATKNLFIQILNPFKRAS